MAKIYPGLYDNYDDAQRAVADLRAAGVPDADIGLIAHNADDRYVPMGSDESTPAGTGAAIGGLIGGAGGLLAGLGIMAIPGIGPVVAAGWFASTLAGAVAGVVAGAATGGIVGALTESGIKEEHAHVYAEGVRRGGTLVTARGDEALAPTVDPVYRRTGAVDPDARGRAYRSEGWSKFDPESPAYNAADVERERLRVRQQNRAAE